MKHISRMLDRELKQGSAELLILSLVETRARHGYEISKLIEERSGGRLKFKVASLYPLLYRLPEGGRGAPRRAREPRARGAPRAAPPLLPPHRRGPQGARRATRQLARVRRSHSPDHGGRTCLNGMP